MVAIQGPWVDSDGRDESDDAWFVDSKSGTFHTLDGAVRNVETTSDVTTHYGLNALVLMIRKWADDRNLIDTPTCHPQMTKLTEECGEVAHAVARGDRAKLKDGIGDMVVVLTILAAQNGLTLEECVAAAYDEIKDRKGRMVNGVFVKDGVDWAKPIETVPCDINPEPVPCEYAGIDEDGTVRFFIRGKWLSGRGEDRHDDEPEDEPWHGTNETMDDDMLPRLRNR